MNKENKVALLKDRLNKIECSGKSIKSMGVVTALRREIRNLENQK